MGLACLALLLAGCFSPAERAIRHDDSGPRTPTAERVALPPPPDEPPAIARTYQITYGDKLIIDDLSVPGSRREQVLVGPDGTISYLHLPRVVAQGRSLDELQNDLREALKVLHRDPHPLVFLDPTSAPGHHVYVFGQVLNPGAIPFDQPLRVLDALAGAGGFAIEVRENLAQQSVDLAHSVLLRDGKSIGVDFTRLVEGGDLRHNVQLHPGDLLMVASLLDQNIYVLGAVNRAGAVPKTANMGTIGALARAGGVREQAWRSGIVVLRGSLAKPDMYIVDLDRILTGKSADLPVENGDVIYVPERPMQYPRELLQIAIRAFVSTLGANAGVDAARELGF